MSENLVIYESKDKIALISLNRPESINAMNNELIDALRGTWHRYNESDDQCAVIRGLGSKGFSAGADYKALPAEMWQGIPGVGVEVNKPIVAAIHGYCIGGAYVLVQMCDLAVAAESSLFSYPEAQIGVSGGLIVGAAARIPHKIAMEFMLTGQRFSAQRAYEVGMINKVVPDSQELEAAMEYAHILSKSAPMVMSMLKKAVNETIFPKSPAEQAALARKELTAITNSEDRAEGAAAFLEKRVPRFKGK